jgi:hypothetical protein
VETFVQYVLVLHVLPVPYYTAHQKQIQANNKQKVTTKSDKIPNIVPSQKKTKHKKQKQFREKRGQDLKVKF